MVQEVVSPSVEVRRLLHPGSSPHSYEPTPSDARLAQDAILVVYASRGLDRWAARLSNAESLELLDLVPDSLRYYPDSASTADPHFWLDPIALRAAVGKLPIVLCRILPEGCSRFTAAADSLNDELTHLDQVIRSQLKVAEPKTLVLATPFFGYFAKRYDMSIVATLGRGDAVDSGPRQIAKVVQQVQASRTPLSGIVSEANQSQAAVRMVAEMLNTQVILIDPIGGPEGRETYDELMRYNLRQLLGEPS